MRNALVAIAITLILVPSAASTWRVAGTFEPDTSYDADWMFEEAAPAGASQVYFAAMTTTRGGPVAVSPNLGLAQTRIEDPAGESHYAILGIWKDCNRDGYIGAAEHALREYNALLVTDLDTCPAANGPAGEWPPGAHNYNGWVSEFVPIGTGNVALGRMYADLDAEVWGDFHRPDETPFFRSCALQPLPRGTLSDTGGFLNYFECRIEQKLYMNGLETFNAIVGATGDPLGLSFEDTSTARSGTAGQFTTLGQESEEYAPVHVWDCDSPTSTPAGNVWGPDPRVNDDAEPTEWSIAALGNHTYEGIDALEDCDPSNDRGRHFYGFVEDDFNGVDPNNKTEADWNFNFIRDFRGGAPGGTIFGAGGAGAPNPDGGIGWHGYQHSAWYPDSQWLSKLGPNTVRASLDEGAGFAPAHWLTFYARLGASTLGRGFALPTTEVGTYGEEHCAGAEDGIHDGWNCDASLWYINPDGTYPQQSVLDASAKPGWKYHLRDVDCYDGSVMGLPTGGPALGEDACA